jgi:hypothetical protein
LCDSYCTNTHYARVGGVSTQELNTLEVEFLFMIGWELYCDTALLQNYYEHLVDHSECYHRVVVQCLEEEESLEAFDKAVYVVK